MERENQYGFEVKAVSYGDSIEYVVNYFDFHNLIGAGDSPDAAIAEAKNNLKAYLAYCDQNNIEIPSPSFNVFNEDISGKMTFRTSKTTHKAIINRAKEEGVSINALLNDAVHYYLERCDIKDIVKELTSDSDLYFSEDSKSFNRKRLILK